MTRRYKKRGPPGWSVAKSVLLDAFASSGKTQPQIGRVRFLGAGLYNAAYQAACTVGEEEIEAVVRLPSRHAPDQDGAVERVDREVAVLRYLAQCGFALRFPRMIATVPMGDTLATVQTYVDGHPVDMRESRSVLVRPA